MSGGRYSTPSKSSLAVCTLQIDDDPPHIAVEAHSNHPLYSVHGMMRMELYHTLDDWVDFMTSEADGMGYTTSQTWLILKNQLSDDSYSQILDRCSQTSARECIREFFAPTTDVCSPFGRYTIPYTTS